MFERASHLTFACRIGLKMFSGNSWTTVAAGPLKHKKCLTAEATPGSHTASGYGLNISLRTSCGFCPLHTPFDSKLMRLNHCIAETCLFHRLFKFAIGYALLAKMEKRRQGAGTSWSVMIRLPRFALVACADCSAAPCLLATATASTV